MAWGGYITDGNAVSPEGTINAVTAVANTAPGYVATAQMYISELGALTASLVPPVITADFPEGGSAPAVSIPEPPSTPVPVWEAPGLPAEFTEVLDTGDLDVAPFDDDPPSITFFSAPDAFQGDLPEAPAVSLDFDDPTLVVSLPAVPDLLSISVTPFGGINLPTFSEAAPELVAVQPSIREYVPGATYNSSLLTALQASLEQRISGGGTGLGQEAETALWERGKEREARSAADAILKLEQLETLGYALPPGGYVDARIKIITETDYAERGHSREVMVESARLELDNVKHALTTATQLEGQLIDANNQVEQRAFEASRYVTEAGISIYNAKVQAYSAMVDVYRAKIAVYEAQVRAEVSRVEAYRAEIAAEEAKASVNRALVDQYRAQVDAALSSIRVYEAEIAGIQAKADIERTKVLIFGEQVRGYTAQVNAYTAQVEGFRAALDGERSKTQLYQSQVEAFAARVNANARQVESRVAAYRGRIEASNSRWEGYKAQADAEAKRVQAFAAINSAVSDIYRSEVTGVSAYNETLTKQWQVSLDQAQRVSEIGVNTAKANAELFMTTRSLALDAAKVGAQVSAQIGAAALNTMNLSASVGASSSYNESNSSSDSNSTSDSTSNSTSTNYNYSASI